MASGKTGKKTWFARKLREWSIAFCENMTNLPEHKFGQFSSSLLSDEDVAGAIHLHLQGLGKWVSANQIARYVRTPEFQARLRVKRNISVRTAQRWMKKMGYRWKKEPKGMYSDGHERADVVNYRQNVFLPQWRDYEASARHWQADASFEEVDHECRMRLFMSDNLDCRPYTIWRQDESIFYANDRRTTRWVHESETAKIRAKGEGASDMIGDFVSPEYGWLRSKRLNVRGEFDDARVLLKPGKKREGYQTTETILAQVTRAMNILDRDYTEDRHVFAYDNATIHTARAPDALSALGMTLGPSNNFNKSNGVYVHMRDATFRDGSAQVLYQANGTTFKGLKVLIQERRAKGHDLPDPDSINPITKKKYLVQCGGSGAFKCRTTMDTKCCLRKMMYSEPDFKNQMSILEEHCQKRGYGVLFFPKFHPELNFIEQCWGYAKRIYRMYPESTSEDDLRANLLDAVASVPIESMRRFATRSSRFGDAYFRGLNGAEAAWANKKYRGHRTLPPSYEEDLREAKTKWPAWKLGPTQK
ncbi:hypothetical protein MIND_00932800 [Mycena indigotica]|uniref:Uncharacterized protein n=1 Tax=Mycena indigotica TaxID=2126181 RepID=A0A8H6SCH1_9AGAR|nr:uncharacterized protein MIND_00932800 [Mycena indigotica]KAF7297005.1 hypothetical protein MIND_00932800 [Mycena indigotica]